MGERKETAEKVSHCHPHLSLDLVSLKLTSFCSLFPDRVGMLERKVHELTSDNDDLRTQLLKTKDTLSTTSHAKEEIYKKMASISKTAQEHKRLSIQEISELENAQQRIFELEEEMKQFKRKAEVDLPNEVGD